MFTTIKTLMRAVSSLLPTHLTNCGLKLNIATGNPYLMSTLSRYLDLCSNVYKLLRFFFTCRWGSEIPYEIHAQYDANTRELIEDVLREISVRACVEFVPRGNQFSFLMYTRGDGSVTFKLNIPHFCRSPAKCVPEP